MGKEMHRPMTVADQGSRRAEKPPPSPRTLNQTLRGAPREFLGAQEVDRGVYDRHAIGVTIPRGWDNAPRFTNRTDLLEQRRRDALPPEGWGLKNALSRKEKFATLRPITAPIGLDASKWPIYPNDPEVQSKNMTRTSLFERRKKENLQHNEIARQKHEAVKEAQVNPWLKSDAFETSMSRAKAEPPVKKVRSEEIEKQKQRARELVGLTTTMTAIDQDCIKKDPVAHTSGNVWYEDPHKYTFIGYRDKPEFPTRSNLAQARRDKMLDDLEAGVSRVAATFKPQIQRLKDREDQYFLQNQLAMADPNNRIRSDLLKERRIENTTNLIDKWGADPPPPDNEARRATPNSRNPFWKYKDRYVEKPHKQSHLQRTQEAKWWKHVPEAYLRPDTQKPWGMGGDLDPYSRPYTKPSERSHAIADKVTSEEGGGVLAKVDPATKQPYIPRPILQNDIRGNNMEHAVKPQYLTEEALAALDSRDNNVPMYSSFSPDRIFHEPQFVSKKKVAQEARDESSDVGGGRSMQQQTRPEQLGPPAKMRDILTYMGRTPAAPAYNTYKDEDSASSPQGAESDSSNYNSYGQLPGSKSLLSRGTQVRSSGFLQSVRPIASRG